VTRAAGTAGRNRPGAAEPDGGPALGDCPRRPPSAAESRLTATVTYLAEGVCVCSVSPLGHRRYPRASTARILTFGTSCWGGRSSGRTSGRPCLGRSPGGLPSSAPSDSPGARGLQLFPPPDHRGTMAAPPGVAPGRSPGA
jgi:hypothetical protein